MTNEIDEVRRVAQTFFDKMVQWEKRSHALFPASDTDKEGLKTELKEIFSEHLTAKAANRKQGRYAAINYSIPPQFARPIQKVEPAEPVAYWVVVPEPVVGFARYHFVRVGDEWKIDYREVEVDDDKWEKELNI